MSSIIGSWWHEIKAPHRSRLLCRVVAVALAVLAGLWAPAASADVALFSVNGQRQVFTGIGIGGAVDLNGAAAGGTSLTFTTTLAKQRVLINFNATCWIPGNATSTQVVITIYVDPAGPVGQIIAPPTETVTLCSNYGEDPTETRASYVTSVRPDLAGTNIIRVFVAPLGGNEFHLSTTTLSVMR